jgi:16S rRNA (guanine(527)-N(7))-methyltransferase RsmG
LTAGLVRFDRPAEAAPALQVVHQPLLGSARPTLDHGQIGFLDTTFTKLSAQTGGGLGGARQRQHAGHRCVQPMHHAHEHPAGFGVAQFEPLFGQIDQAGLFLLVALHYQTRWFIKHQQVIVFIKDRPTRMKKEHAATPPPKPGQRSGRTLSRAGGQAPDRRTLAAIFQSCDIALDPQQIEQFWLYHGLLRHHNTELNLTRIHSFANMVIKLYVDAALPAHLTDLPAPLMDLGSGPGMPGIPLKIMRPDLEIVLAEGRAKRVVFLNTVIAELGLEGIRVIDRNITAEFEQPFNGVITRAVERIDRTLERVQGCLRQNGRMIFMKGPACEPEIEQALQRFEGRFALVENRAYRIGQTAHQRVLVVFERLDAPHRAMAAQAVRRHRMTSINSEQNNRFKDLKKLLTSRGIKKAGQALLSGARPIKEVLEALPQRCVAWITSGDQHPPPQDAPDAMEWLQLSDPLYQMLDIFGTRGALLLIDVPQIEPWSPEEGFAAGCNLLVPFQDPENIGAVIRSAAAFGVSQVILLAESAHPFHPKALRTSGGTAMRVRLRQGPALADVPRHLPIMALSADGQDISTLRFPPAFGLLAGLEGQGLPTHWRGSAVRIPIDPAVESLNAATAAAVALYAWRRQGRE